MKEFTATLGENGRMIIPALLRKTLDLKAGDEVVVRLSADNDIVIHSPKQSLRKLQVLLTSKGNNDKSLVDSLIEMRRNEEI
jgi:AbrB family looped-hinge helix DNA binding protein